MPYPPLSSGKSLLIPQSQQRRFVLEFALYTFGGWLFGYRSAESLSGFPMPLPFLVQLARYMAWGYWGTCIGLVQWFALRERLYRPGRWIWANAAGWILLSAIAIAANPSLANLPSDIPTVSDFPNPDGLEALSPGLLTQLRLEPLMRSSLGGLCLGIAQWFVLRDSVVPSLWWIGVPAIANLLSQFACNTIFTVLPSEHLAYCVRILLFGLIQAIAFCRCHRSSNSG